jgi:hypothetical protein
MSEPTSVAQKREKIVSLLEEIDCESETDSVVDFYPMEVSAKSTRLGWLAVTYLYQILADDDEQAAWEQTANQLRDRLRVNVLGVHDYDDPLDGRPFRSAELDELIDMLEQYREAN